MARVLFILFNGSGRVLPAVGVARALRERGADVGIVTVPGSFTSGGDPLGRLRSIGVQILDSPPDPPGCQPAAIYPGTQAEEISRFLNRNKAETLELRRQRQITPVRHQIEPLREIIRNFAPDLVVADTLSYQAAISSHLEHVPFVGYSASLRMIAPPEVEYDLDSRDLLPEAQGLFAEYGLQVPRMASIEYVSPHGNTVFAAPELATSGYANRELITLVGPPKGSEREGHIDFPWERVATDRPRVFISFGTVLRWEPELHDMIIAAAEPLGVQCIVSAGELVNKHPFPPDVLAVAYAPQVALLERIDVFVTVGGANSMNESMSAGVPMLVVPIMSDQPVQGYVVEAARLGRCVPAKGRSVERIREALASILDPAQGYRERAREMQRRYNAADGARGAAEAILAAVARTKS